MPKLLTAAVVSSVFFSLGLPSHAQRLPPPLEPPPLPSPSSVPPSVTTPSLAPGDFGADVAALQRALDRNGIDPGPIDGAYGPMTRSAVEQFQQIYDLPVTGVAGPSTLDILGINPTEAIEVVVVDDDGDVQSDDTPYIAAVIESTSKLGQVRNSFDNAVVDYVRQGEFINIGRYSSHSDAMSRVREARSLGFDARILYRR
ncbi:peptidoglycan-binding domain-containing protein [Leptolyngbya sp. Heron Island J]|uniref:peptidoglycan-binding domain-containing protein n=1 Tax=Leptolyngbya sp. Heron Island J TaxID=1385935 RepID=UPI00041A4928|nr:peptidoglycan-binding domain-containing protein [Leptolyngbya sp. Heron Island J]